jgi:hypothetical protein
MAKNVYSVPKKVWGGWSKDAQKVFNRSYHFYINNKRVMVHPECPEISQNHWRTIAWNSAWIASNSVDHIISEVVGGHEDDK